MSVNGTMQVECTKSDGTTILATVHFDPSTGALQSASVVNSSSSTQQVLITDNSTGLVHTVDVPGGTTNLSAAQLQAAGFTNISQIRVFTVSCS